MMKKALDYIEKYEMIREHDRVIAGVSGGADSVCLLFVLQTLRETKEFTLEVVHVEHGIRGTESLEDAGFTEALCRRCGIPFHLKCYDVPARAAWEKLTMEEAARKCRYEAFEEIRRQVPGTKIAVAHNQDDQAETILWNLVRGSGLRGLGGMRPVNGEIIRPLLCVSRKEIEDWLAKLGQEYRTDSTNLEDTYTRNKVRHQILPMMEQGLNRQAGVHIAQAGERMRKAEDYLQKLTAEKAARMGEKKKEELWIRKEAFLEEEELMQEYLLRFWFAQLEMGLKNISAVHIEDIKRLAAGNSGKSVHLPAGRQVRCTQEYLVIGYPQKEEKGLQPMPLLVPGESVWGRYRIITALENYKNQRIPEKKYTKWFDYDKIKDMIYLRSRCSGDYLVVDAKGSRKTLKKYFIDEKVLQDERNHIPLIADGAHILWVVGYRISQEYKVTDTTKRILKVQIKEEHKDGT